MVKVSSLKIFGDLYYENVLDFYMLCSFMGHVTYKERQSTMPHVQTYPQQVYRPKVTIIANEIHISNAFTAFHVLGTDVFTT